MNQKDVAIIESLIANDSLEFMELLKETRNKTWISKGTLSTHLKQLESEGFIRHHKKKYSLDASKSLKKHHRDISKDLLQWEKKIDRLPRSSNISADGFNLLAKIFRGTYTPMLFDLHCNENNLNSYQKYAIKKNIKRCEEMIKKTVDILEDYSPSITENILGVIKLGYL